MGNIFNEDFRDFIKCLNLCKVDYMLVGGYAVIFHGHPRTTGDMDIWVKRSPENYKKLTLAFLKFRMPMFDMTEDNFLYHPNWDVFRFGRPPVAIDIMVKMGNFDFEDCYNKIVEYYDGDLKIKIIHINQLKEAKKQAGRPKDLDDLQNL
jgi:hypothetical protein